MPNPTLFAISPADILPGVSSPTLPSAWAATVESQLSDAEQVLAWMEIDLDARLHFTSGLVVVTNRRLLASTANGAIWSDWAYQPGLTLVRYDQSGIG
ncbi:MAG: ABC transporter, partial [Nitrosospira sp.]|nr:ABC transporter [Nitrosospira sp.]